MLRVRFSIRAAVLLIPILTAGQWRGEPATRVDRYGDPLPPGAITRLGTVRLRHGSIIQAAEFSPDGKLLFTADGTIKAWDATSGALRWQAATGRYGSHNSLAVSADCRRLVSGSSSSIRLWDAATGRLVNELNPSPDDPFDGVTFLAFSPDGTSLWCLRRKGILRRYALANDRGNVTFQRSTGSYIGRLSHSGTTVAHGHGSVLSLADIETFAEQHVLAARADVYTCAFSPDDRWIAASVDNAWIQVWDTKTGKLAFERERPNGAWRPWIQFDGSGRLVTSGQDGILRFWDVAAGREVKTISAQPGQAIVSDDGARVCIIGPAQNGVTIFDATTGRESPQLIGHDYAVTELDYSPDSSKLVTSTSNDRTTRIWDVHSSEQLVELPGTLQGIRWSTGVGRAICHDYLRKSCELFQLPTGTRLGPIDPEIMGTATFSADDKLLVMGLQHIKAVEPQLRMTHALGAWNLPECEVRWRLDDIYASGLVYSPTNRILAGVVRELHDKRFPADVATLWDGETGKQLLRVADSEPTSDRPSFGTLTLAFSSDGKRLALGGGDRPPLLVEVPSGKVLRTFTKAERGFQQRVGFSPGDRHLTVGPTPLQCWNLETGEKIATFGDASDRSVISPDGTQIVSSNGRRGTLRLLDFANAAELASTKLDGVASIAFSPDGKTFATGLADGTVLIWPADPSQWPKAASESPSTPVDRLWQDLSNRAEQAFPAMDEFVAQPQAAVALFHQRLKEEPAELGNVDAWIAALRQPPGPAREEALEALTALGASAAPALRRSLAQEQVNESKSLLEGLLAEGDSPFIKSAWDLRRHRAIQVLERIGSKEARELLQEIQRQQHSPREVREAEAALARLQKAVESQR